MIKLCPRVPTIASAAVIVGSSLTLSLSTAPAAAQVDVVELTVQDIQAGLAGGSFTSVDLVSSFLDRIDTFEPTYNAFISLYGSEALARAAELDAEYRLTGPRSPLHGVPIVIKDNMDLAGKVTTNGFKGFSSATGGIDIVPELDATMVSRLEAAGAIILGKTNLPDFAQDGTRTNSSVEGQTLNPYNPLKVPGGSSGGTATAVNASFAVLGMGTETGTSIHNPSTFQGLVGVRPTQGLIPIDGIYPLSGTFRDVTGPLAKTVYDAAVVLDAVAGYAPRDRLTYDAETNPNGYTSKLSLDALLGANIGIFDPAFKTGEDPFLPEGVALYEQALSVIEGLGANLNRTTYLDDGGFDEFLATSPRTPATFQYDQAQYLEALGDSAAFNSISEYNDLIEAMYAGMPDMIAEYRRPEPQPGSRDSLVDPFTRTNSQDQAWIDFRNDLRKLFEQILDDNGLDGLVFPVYARPLFELDSNGRNIGTLSGTINILGIPGVIVNAGYFGPGDIDGDGLDDEGDPFALAFLGRRFDEADVLGYAYAYEQATMLRVAPTLVPEPASVLALAGSAGVLLMRRRRRVA